MTALNHSVLIDQIKEHLTVQEAAERYTSMDFSRVRGSRNTLSLRCPFHEDKSPSFTLWLESNRWKCHAGCGHGDVIDLVAIALDIDVKEAIKLLADNLGLSEKPLDKKKASELKKKAKARAADRQLVQTFKSQFNDVFQRMLALERRIEDTLSGIKSLSDLESIGDLYHIRDYIGYLLDCMISPEEDTQIEAFKAANEVLTKWQRPTY